MTDSSSNGTTGDTSSTLSPSVYSRSRSFAALAGEIVAMAGAAFATWLIRTDPEVPWQYRFWGTVGVSASLLLPRALLDKVVTAALGRFMPGNGNSGPK